MEENDKQSSESKFNMGLAELEKIHTKFTAFDYAILQEKELILASSILSSLCDDIDFILTDPEKTLIADNEKEIVDYLKLFPLIDSSYLVKDGGYIRYYANFPTQRVIFQNKLRIQLRLLRELMRKHNLLMPEKGEGKLF